MTAPTISIAELISAGALAMSDGYRTKREELGLDGFRILRAADVTNGSVSFQSTDFVRTEFAPAIGAKIVRSGDVVLTTKGTVGRVALVSEIQSQAVYSPQLCFFRVANSGTIDPKFLRYWFASPEFWTQASHRMNNSDMAPYINLADIRSLRLTLPTMGQQRAMTDVLGSLDAKIASNVNLIGATDQLALTVYCATPTSDSRVPTDFADFINGKAFTKGASGSGRVVIRIAELNSGIGKSTVYSDIEVAETHLARPGDLLFAWSGSLTVRRWYRSEAIINQHIFKVIPKIDTPMWLVNQVLQRRLAEFKLIAADKATTMGHIQRRHLEEPVPLPSGADIAKIDPLMRSLWDRALAAEQENLLLEELRDTLLPHLMSGRLRVRDAEKQVEDVV